MRVPKQHPVWKAGFEAAKLLYENRYNFVADPQRQCATAKRLAVVCPTCRVSEFQWCKFVGGTKKGQHTTILHVSRQGK